ncbi:MAG: ketoacyl-ACP synthase III [Deltaproteobacteria bacterium]|nr:ketoacyl-ACP synthase III [Deltaproteobacteria bacterium]
MKARIIGTGSSVPSKVLTNADLELMVDTSDEWITTRTGIRERRIAVRESASGMATEAARIALERGEVSPGDIDLVVVATVTPDRYFPSTACLVQSNLGIKRGAMAFDLSAACSGFLYALDVASRYVNSGDSKKALVIGVDLFSKIIDWKDRNTCVLFGDGAGAVVLSAEEGDRGVLSTHSHSEGNLWEMLYTPSVATPCGTDGSNDEVPYLKMQGSELFKAAVRTMREACEEALNYNNVSPNDIALLIPHQANQRIIRATQERLGLTDEQVFLNLDRYGNTSAGSIPLALDEAVRGGRLHEGDLILLVAFGGGLTWASALVRW